MPQFRTLDQLANHIRVNHNVPVSMYGGGRLTTKRISMWKEIMEEAADKLANLIEDEIQYYYDSYQPKQYKRTYKFKRALRVGNVVSEKRDNSVYFYVRIDFDQDLSTHPSIFNGEDGFVPTLINEGWAWKSKTGPYRLASYNGWNFAENAIDRFRKESISTLHFIPRIQKSVYHNGSSVDFKEWNSYD